MDRRSNDYLKLGKRADIQFAENIHMLHNALLGWKWHKIEKWKWCVLNIKRGRKVRTAENNKQIWKKDKEKKRNTQVEKKV